ncbi:ATP-binding cassette domain-containing protein [Kordiimonas sp. SCSIO 12603]|uniref:ABC transporter ATP-binding protein n=1 Tax=Kordiimonas sp. SCSIO 12603 TaxID=2829596 RepID=UPI002102FE2F|nr:ATP-binding cassette domain-containing protein [Kordiimonas sp. SCSIO 12603]UTW57171.1 ATP-binding cassette domain-containing protein [Kordiimonas sp. SCSIO 12603]
MISVENISKSYGDVQAVKGMTFQAQDAQITTLLGANGSGKTTTLRSISGLLKQDGGAVKVDGIDVKQDTIAAQRRLGVFPDSFGLYTRLTTREHMEYFAELHGLHGSALDAAVSEVSERLNLEDILDRRTEGFSQGQRMKVALSRAIMHKPQNIVLDEPTRGLDVMNIRLLRHILQELKDAGHCVLLSSHVMAEVEILSDHVVMMADGVVCAEGSPQELIAKSGQPNLEEAFVVLTGQKDHQERNVA